MTFACLPWTLPRLSWVILPEVIAGEWAPLLVSRRKHVDMGEKYIQPLPRTREVTEPRARLLLWAEPPWATLKKKQSRCDRTAIKRMWSGAHVSHEISDTAGTCQCVCWVLFALDLARRRSSLWCTPELGESSRECAWHCQLRLTWGYPFPADTSDIKSEITSRSGRARWQRCWCTGFHLLAALRRVPLHLSSRQHLAERESNVGMNVCCGTANHHSSFVAANQHTKITKFLVYVFSFCLDSVVGPTDMTAQALYFSCMMSYGSKYFILNSYTYSNLPLHLQRVLSNHHDNIIHVHHQSDVLCIQLDVTWHTDDFPETNYFPMWWWSALALAVGHHECRRMPCAVGRPTVDFDHSDSASGSSK